jgi:glutamate synthase (ferredoxin)
MSGGTAYVLDEDNTLYRNLNKQLVRMENVETKTDREELRRIIERHVKHTGSAKGRDILEHFDAYVPRFKKIIHSDYKEILKLIARSEENGTDPETAKIEAFRAFVGGA